MFSTSWPISVRGENGTRRCLIGGPGGRRRPVLPLMVAAAGVLRSGRPAPTPSGRRRSASGQGASGGGPGRGAADGSDGAGGQVAGRLAAVADRRSASLKARATAAASSCRALGRRNRRRKRRRSRHRRQLVARRRRIARRTPRARKPALRIGARPRDSDRARGLPPARTWAPARTRSAARSDAGTAARTLRPRAAAGRFPPHEGARAPSRRRPRMYSRHLGNCRRGVTPVRDCTRSRAPARMASASGAGNARCSGSSWLALQRADRAFERHAETAQHLRRCALAVADDRRQHDGAVDLAPPAAARRRCRGFEDAAHVRRHDEFDVRHLRARREAGELRVHLGHQLRDVDVAGGQHQHGFGIVAERQKHMLERHFAVATRPRIVRRPRQRRGEARRHGDSTEALGHHERASPGGGSSASAQFGAGHGKVG